MPLRRLTGRQRSTAANWQLAALLAFTAGAVDVSGYMAFHQFTSHMSGLVAAAAADVAMHTWHFVIVSAAVFFSFVGGAAVCAILVNWLRRRDRESIYAVPVLLEAILLAAIALLPLLAHPLLALALFSFSMGLQNASITKISNSEIRTTHITGMVTDIGIEIGKLIYIHKEDGRPPVRADRRSLALLTLLVSLFFLGGAIGAVVYPHIGFHLLLVLAAVLALPTILPIAADLRSA